jgi:hypothetical protein
MVFLAASLLAAGLATPIPVQSGPVAAPVCALPEVLDVVAAELQKRGVHGELDGTSVGEKTEPGAPTALCSVRVLLPYYDTDRFGEGTQYRMVVRSYRVRRQPWSFLVTLLD